VARRVRWQGRREYIPGRHAGPPAPRWAPPGLDMVERAERVAAGLYDCGQPAPADPGADPGGCDALAAEAAAAGWHAECGYPEDSPGCRLACGPRLGPEPPPCR
jgi:hypothetical protein